MLNVVRLARDPMPARLAASWRSVRQWRWCWASRWAVIGHLVSILTSDWTTDLILTSDWSRMTRTSSTWWCVTAWRTTGSGRPYSWWTSAAAWWGRRSCRPSRRSRTLTPPPTFCPTHTSRQDNFYFAVVLSNQSSCPTLCPILPCFWFVLVCKL